MKTLTLILLAVLILDALAESLPGELKEEQKFGNYTVRVYRDDENASARFEVLRSGKRVYSKAGDRFNIGKIYYHDSDTNTTIKIGRSITSDRQPNLVVFEMAGGNNSDWTYYIFQIGNQFKLVSQIKGAYIEDPAFQDLRGDNNLEVVLGDNAFFYWNVCGADSQKMKVILRYQSGRYAPDVELMRKPKPTAAELKRMAAEFKVKFHESNIGDEWGVPFALWQEMLDEIYTGNSTSAWRLFDLSWPADRPGKEMFLQAFRKRLNTSQYYKDIMQPGFQGD